MSPRTFSSLIIAVAILFLPYWIYMTLALAATILFPIYWEAIFFGFLIDILYGRGVAHLTSPLALGALILIVALVPLRDRIRAYG